MGLPRTRGAATPHDDRISSGAHCGARDRGRDTRSRGRDTGRNIGRDTNARGARGASTSSASTSSTATNSGACRWCHCPCRRHQQKPSLPSATEEAVSIEAHLRKSVEPPFLILLVTTRRR